MKFKRMKHLSDNTYISGNILKLITFVIIAAVILISLYPKGMIKKYHYKLGDIAKKDIKATEEFSVIDREATEDKKRYAKEAHLTVYDCYDNLADTLIKRAEKAFFEMEAVIKDAEAFSDEDKKRKQDYAIERFLAKKPDFYKILGINLDNNIYDFLIEYKFSDKIPGYIGKVLSVIYDNGVVSDKDMLLQDIDKGIILRSVETKKEDIIKSEKVLKRFYDINQAQEMVRIVGQPILKNEKKEIIDITVAIARSLIRSNITLNVNETEERRKKAALEIEPVYEKIKSGEMILREGDKVTDVHIDRLEALALKARHKINFMKGIANTFILLIILLTIYFTVSHYKDEKNFNKNKNFIFVSSVFLLFFLIIKGSVAIVDILGADSSILYSPQSLYFGIPVAAGSMLVSIFIGRNTGMMFSVLLACSAAVILEGKLEIFIYFLVNGFFGVYWAREFKERRVFIKAGAKLAALNFFLIVFIDFYIGEILSVTSLWNWIFAFLGGISAGVVTSGFVPLIEFIFGYVTDITLLELGNLEQPILKKLMMEAPGTYHHSVIVGSMAEAAAFEIGANPLLAKVCGYYHDIGKSKKPLYFIENQLNGKNYHDKLAPSMSSLILTAHVKEGVELAKRYKLGEDIINTIRQHHGTRVISYFYERAKHLKSKAEVNINDYRYPGPKPQTKEAALVMLADAVEAASKTLENPTTSRIQGLIQRIINDIFTDGQLDNCDLTLRDFHSIAKSFYKFLNGIYHHRIEYPEKNQHTNGKDKNAGSDKKQPKQPEDKHKENQSKSAGSLKRLGLSKH
ncbi:MAG: HDIG domain-containing protein [Deltaproteobacteria bacterium]|nr:HDIG domain-containing protein [Deltaproteobacteria bacterium]